MFLWSVEEKSKELLNAEALSNINVEEKEAPVSPVCDNTSVWVQATTFIFVIITSILWGVVKKSHDSEIAWLAGIIFCICMLIFLVLFFHFWLRGNENKVIGSIFFIGIIAAIVFVYLYFEQFEEGAANPLLNSFGLFFSGVTFFFSLFYGAFLIFRFFLNKCDAAQTCSLLVEKEMFENLKAKTKCENMQAFLLLVKKENEKKMKT